MFGLPLAIIYFLVLLAAGVGKLPSPGPIFWVWAVGAALSQILATSVQLHVMGSRNFATAVAYAKTEVVQAAVFEAVFLGAFVSGLGALGIALATVAVMLMSLMVRSRMMRATARASSRCRGRASA